MRNNPGLKVDLESREKPAAAAARRPPTVPARSVFCTFRMSKFCTELEFKNLGSLHGHDIVDTLHHLSTSANPSEHMLMRVIGPHQASGQQPPPRQLSRRRPRPGRAGGLAPRRGRGGEGRNRRAEPARVGAGAGTTTVS